MMPRRLPTPRAALALLLGLLREEGSVAASVLAGKGVRLDDVRKTIADFSRAPDPPFDVRVDLRRKIDDIRQSVHQLALNDIGRIRLRTSKPLAFDDYARNRATGAFILVDEATNDTVGAGMVVEASP